MNPPPAKVAATDPQPAKQTGRRLPGRGGSTHQHRLALKKAAVSAPPPPISSPATSTSSPAATTPSPAASTLGPAIHSTSSTAPISMPPWTPQGTGCGTIPPKLALGNQQCPNPWIYPPGGFFNMIHEPQVQEENFHLVGQTRAFIAMSPTPPSNAYGTG